jgi:RNA polymerase sigma factor (sigma-70 family)
MPTPDLQTLSGVLVVLRSSDSTPDAKQRHGWAWESLYRLTRQRIFVLCYRITRGHVDLVEDICQDVYAKLLQRPPFDRISDGDHLLAYLQAMACHTAMDHLRSRRRRAYTELPADVGPGVPSPLTGPSAAESPEGIAMRDELYEIAMRQLKGADRDLFEMLVSSVPVKAISRTLQVSPETARVRIFRLRKRLRQVFLDFEIPLAGIE